ADAAAVMEEAPEVAASLREYARVVFRPYAFAPAGEPLIVDEELAGVAVEIGQSLEAIRHLAGVYAARLRRWRAGGRAPAGATGLDGVALPATIAPRAELPVAMGMAVRRCWRARDRLATGGLLARSRGVPGFAWLGMDIDAMPTYLAEMAAAEYVAIRSMFL